MKPFHIPAALVEQLGWVLVHSVWQLALVGAAALLLARLMRRCTAKTRYAMLIAALAVMTLAPVATLLVLPEPRPAAVVEVDSRLAPGSPWVKDDWSPPADLPMVAEPVVAALPASDAEAAETTIATEPDALPLVDEPADEGARAGVWDWLVSLWAWALSVWADGELAVRAWLEWIVGLWCLGVFVFAWRPAVSWYEVGRLRRVGLQPAADRVAVALGELARRMRLSRPVRIFESTRVHVPVVVGYLRPMVLLPVSLVSQLPVAQLEAILAHELAHIRRHDYVVNLWQTLVETALFYHPAVWWLSHRIRQERENCCDDIAVALVENRVEYGRALLMLQELRGTHTALALGARSGSLLARIGRLFPSERGERPFDSGNAVAVGLLACSILAAAVWATAVAKAPDEAAPSSEVAEEETDPDASYYDAVSERFAAALETKNLPYVTPQALAALKIELHDYLADRVTRPLAGPARAGVLKEIDRFVQQNFGEGVRFFGFRDNFDVLKWELWTASDRRELSPAELAERETQRTWIRDFIRSVPFTKLGKNASIQGAEQLQILESDLLGNPLIPFFDDPMSPDEFERFKRDVLAVKDRAGWENGPFVVGEISMAAVRARSESLQRRWPPACAVNANLQGLAANGSEAHRSSHNGMHITQFRFYYTFNYLFSGATNWYLQDLGGERNYYDVAENRPVTPPPGLDKDGADRWLAKNKQGDLAWDATTRRLIAVRGARLTTLTETEWYLTDRIPLAQLRKRLADAPQESYSLADVPVNCGPVEMEAEPGECVLPTLPTLVLETAEGKVALLRITETHPKMLFFMVIRRPLPPNPPFGPGEIEGVEENAPVTAGVGGTVGGTIAAVCDRFAAALKKQNLPYVTPQAVAALRAELHGYLADRVKKPLAEPARGEVLKAIDGFVQKFLRADFYMSFRDHFDVLKWELWTATERRELTADELAERDSQRNWMRDYVRSLPTTADEQKVPQWRLEPQLERIEGEVFNNPLSPFFADPMSPDEFERFKTSLLRIQEQSKGGQLVFAPSNLFIQSVNVRLKSLQKRWPPGVALNGEAGVSSIGSTQELTFNCLFSRDFGSRNVSDTPHGKRDYFDVAQHYSVEPPAGLDDKAVEGWLSKNGRGDFSFDAATSRLFPVRGARLIALDERDWYLTDRIPLADLKKRLADGPLGFYSLADVPALNGPGGYQAREDAVAKLPILAVESAEGNVMLLQIFSLSPGSVAFQTQHRPLPPNLPFHPGDMEHPDFDQRAAAIETVGAVCDRFAAALKKQDLPYVTPQAVAALRAELHDYLGPRVTKPLIGLARDEVLKAVDGFAARNFSGPNSYLAFRGTFDRLKWQLWTALDRAELTPAELKERETQRGWMRDYIGKLPIPENQKNMPEYSHANRLNVLEREVFGNPLSPFFQDPMTPEEFEGFQKLVFNQGGILAQAPTIVFQSALKTRFDAVKKRWPSEFAEHGYSVGNSTQDFDFFRLGTDGFCSLGDAYVSESQPARRVYYDAGKNREVEQPAPLDEAATERWLAEGNQGDVWFDTEAKSLVAVRGARLATLDEADWYAVDRIPMAQLRRRVAESPLDSYALPNPTFWDETKSIVAVNKAVQNLPLLVLETAAGKIVLLRITEYRGGRSGGSSVGRVLPSTDNPVRVGLQYRPRPLPPNPPFAAGDVDQAEHEVSMARVSGAVGGTSDQLSGAGAETTDAKDQPAVAERVLHFPADRTMGIVYQRESQEKGYVHGLYSEEWKKVGEARGDVRVPAGKELRLDLSKGASADLAGLDGLEPDDLAVLNCGRTDVTDEGLGHIGRLTGLLILDLESSPISDAGTGHLAGLKKLRFVNLEAFKVNREGFGVGDETLKVLAGLPALETIRLRDSKVTGAGLAVLGPLKSLSHLGLAGTKIGDAGLASLNQLPALVSLDLGVYNTGAGVTDEGLKTIGEMVQLKRLNLSGNKITDAGLVHLQKLARLDNLALDNTGITEAGLANLEPLQALENLRLYTGHPVTDVGAAYLAKLKSLRRLTENLRLTDVGLALLATLPKLEELSLTDSTISLDGARQIVGMKALKWLHFQRCPIGDPELAAMANLPNVEWLQLADTHVSGDGLKSLTGMPKLRILQIDFGDRHEQPEGLKPSLRQVAWLGQITALRVRGWGLDDSDLKDITGMSNLEELELDWPVDDQGALYIAGLRHLKRLDLRSSVLTDVGMKHLSNLRALTFLNLSGHFSDRGLESLTKLKSLWGMQVHSPYITKAGIQELEQQLPALQYCNVWSDSSQDRVVTSDKDTIRRYGDTDERSAKDALEDKPPPRLRLTDWLNAEPSGLDLDKLRGKVVLVDFWGTWCGPCRALTPKLKALDEKYRDQGLVILGVHTASGAEKMPEYVAEHKIGWPTAVDVDKTTADAWRVTSYPTLYLVDRWGNLRMAGIYRDDAEGAVVELLGEKEPPQPAAADAGGKPEAKP